MTNPAWIEEFRKKWQIKMMEYYNTHGVSNNEWIIDFIKSLLSSELQAVLGEERVECGDKSDNEAIYYESGWNAHYQECLKRGRERGIIN